MFVGCEGESEVGYAALLGHFAKAAGLQIRIDPVLLKPGAGDPLALIELAIRKIAHEEHRAETPYAVRAVLLDADRRGITLERDARIAGLAHRARLRVIWQEPCHEAVPLRHLDGCADRRPPTTKDAERELRRHWPDYAKPMIAAELATRLSIASLHSVCRVEAELAAFLAEVGLAS